jgi:hypothetical protein
MTLTIEISPELESQVREQAAQQGLGADEYVVNVLRQYLRETERPKTSCLPETEARLLAQINEGFPPDWWQRYNELTEKRRAETLTPEEQATLIGLSDQIEELNARRIQHLIELARLRQTSLPELMEQLGIKPAPYL